MQIERLSLGRCASKVGGALHGALVLLLQAPHDGVELLQAGPQPLKLLALGGCCVVCLPQSPACTAAA